MYVCMQVGHMENAIGWYHSHPGYGCWLSGIDVSTQMLNQQYQEPWVAIVVDPIQTMSAGKVNIGAFRTYPEVSSTHANQHTSPPPPFPPPPSPSPLRTTVQLMKGLRSTRAYHWTRLRTLVFTARDTTRSASATSSPRWTPASWTCSGTSTGSTHSPPHPCSL